MCVKRAEIFKGFQGSKQEEIMGQHLQTAAKTLIVVSNLNNKSTNNCKVIEGNVTEN